MAWLVANDPNLSQILVASKLKHGQPLDLPLCPFVKWITLAVHTPLSNLLELFLLFLDLIPLPSIP